jgi:hypothetical protein
MRGYLAVVIALSAAPTFADITQPDIAGKWATFLSPFGQSFTATPNERLVQTVSFMWGTPINESLPDPTIGIELRSGVGFTGATLASATVTAIPDSTPFRTWIDFTFAAPVTLVEGQNYTLQFTTLDSEQTSGAYCVGSGSFDDYPGGHFLRSDIPMDTKQDLTFRVAGVPEPTTVTFLAVGVLIVASRRRPTSLNRV